MKDNVPVLFPNEAVGTKVTEYSDSKSSGLPEVLVKYHDTLLSRSDANYTISKFQAKMLTFIARSIGAKRALEIGVYLGFSSMVWSNAVGPDGKVTGLEFSEEYAEQARERIKANGFSNIEIVVGNALETLPKLSPAEPYDIIFIDADKASYPTYLQTILDRSQPDSAGRLLRPGGLIVADNVLRKGLVADNSESNPHFVKQAALRSTYWSPDDLSRLDEFNSVMGSHKRIEGLLLPLFDGVGLGRLVD